MPKKKPADTKAEFEAMARKRLRVRREVMGDCTWTVQHLTDDGHAWITSCRCADKGDARTIYEMYIAITVALAMEEAVNSSGGRKVDGRNN